MTLDTIWLAMLILPVCLGGCTANKVVSQWRNGNLIADGSDSEWQVAPQYYDEKRRLAIRVTNDAEGLYLSITTSDESIKRQLLMAGLTIWLDPKGEKDRIFGIHLPGSGPAGPRPKPQDKGSLPPAGDNGSHRGAKRDLLPPVGLPTELSITYADTTGPLTMRLSEVRRTGIDIGVGQSPARRLVYEFTIAFNAAPCLSGLAPEMVVGIGVVAGASKQGRPQAGSRGGAPGGPGGIMPGPGFDDGVNAMNGPPPGGGPGGGPGAGKKSGSLEVWLQVRLAGRAKG
jgi:hypothetical protein